MKAPPVLPLKPDFAFEAACRAQGLWPVAGVDEAGRGPLAGPVVAAAVILDPLAIPDGLNDSKKLDRARREALYDPIVASAVAVCIASVSATMIDAINIRQATLLAMRRAVLGLSVRPSHVLVDGRDVPVLPLGMGGEAVVKGDARALSIAAASIIAKVSRDRLMDKAGEFYPAYGFARHKGYGTVAHRKTMADYGPSGLHRLSFRTHGTGE